MEVMQSVLSALDPARLDAMSRQLGATPQQTERAIEAALPLLLGQLARNSAQPQGAQQLHRALATDHAGVDLEGLLGAVLGGGQSPRGNDPLADGAGILQHVFGQRQQRVANSVGQFGGLNGQQGARLLSMLAPIVMAMLSRAMQNRGGTTSGLGDVLGNEQRTIERQPSAGGLLSKVLDRDGDGDVDVSDLLGGGRLLGGLLGRQ
jgi:hypothetical protein